MRKKMHIIDFIRMKTITDYTLQYALLREEPRKIQTIMFITSRLSRHCNMYVVDSENTMMGNSGVL